MVNPVKKLAYIGSVLLICISSVLSHAMVAGADEQLSAVLEGIFKRYGELKGISIPYKLESITKSMAMLGKGAKSDKAAGTILFMPPNYLSIRQTTPGKETVTTDGNTVWYYIESKKVAYEYQAETLDKLIKPLSKIFSGLSKAEDNFDITQSDLEDKTNYHLKLVPNPASEEVDYIDLLVEKNGFNVRVIEIHNILGGITRYTLEDLSLRKDLQKKDFIFKAPEGVTIKKEP